MKNIICWWSGGVTSAVACQIAIEIYGIDACSFVFIDTKNESDDTYRFKRDCEGWYKKPIETISNYKYSEISAVWRKFKALNHANGAICSAELKRSVRKEYQSSVSYDAQVFGFDIDEPKRAKALLLNYPEAKPIFPLLFFGLSKKDCIRRLEVDGIEIPEMYKLGFKNNNCFKTGCVQGGIGYWQKMMREFPDKFEAMAKIEHELTDLKGSPVTMLKDQSNAAKQSGNILVFLKKNPKYPNLKELMEMPQCIVEPLFECNGMCGINDFSDKSNTYNQLNIFE